MNTIDKIARELYANGKLSFAECAAIIGAVQYIAAEIHDNTPLGKAFIGDFGTIARDGIDCLTSEESEESEDK